MTRSIYLILNEDNDHIKIGISKNATKRVKQLQTGSSSKLTLLYEREVEHASKVERNLHQYYKDYRVHGEWFELPDDIYTAIDNKIGVYETMFKTLVSHNNPFV